MKKMEELTYDELNGILISLLLIGIIGSSANKALEEHYGSEEAIINQVRKLSASLQSKKITRDLVIAAVDDMQNLCVNLSVAIAKQMED